MVRVESSMIAALLWDFQVAACGRGSECEYGVRKDVLQAAGRQAFSYQ